VTVESALLAAFARQLGPLELIRHRAAPWHSATFVGERHTFDVATAAEVDIEAFARTIAEQDVSIPRGFVADIAVSDAGKPIGTRLTIEVLTIDA